MLIHRDEFVKAHSDCWITRQVADFPVVNAHAVDVAASPDAVFHALDARETLLPKWHWRALMGIRGALGRIFGWDNGLCWGDDGKPLVPGNHYAFFRIEHVMPPRTNPAAPGELGLSVENKLTRALLSFVIVPTAKGSRLYNVTCAVFKGRLGRAYWRVIRPFHNGLTEDWLAVLRTLAESKR